MRGYLGRQQIPIARLILWYRLLEASQSGRPKFHAIEILAQAIQRFDQIVDDHFFGRFRYHNWASIPHRADRLIGIFSLMLKDFGAFWFREWQSPAWQIYRWAGSIVFCSRVRKMPPSFLFFSYLQTAFRHVDEHRAGGFGEQRRIGAGHENLRTKLGELIV
jgi:hypothetical protein